MVSDRFIDCGSVVSRQQRSRYRGIDDSGMISPGVKKKGDAEIAGFELSADAHLLRGVFG